ncbi:MAG: tetratricopeptide repeat protein [Proteobacteria bacterium]|nr:tetratricopeptide repeat protein [Pseudomonadota bacterium]
MAIWLSRFQRPAALAVCASLLGLGLASSSAWAADPKPPTISPEVTKFLKPAQDAIQKKDFDTGIAKAREGLAIAKKPYDYDREVALKLLGAAGGGKGDYEIYAEAWEELVTMEGVPADEKMRAYRALSQIFGKGGNYEKAVPYAKKWVDAGGGSDAYSFLATLYLIQKDCANGVVALEKSVEGKEASETELKREYQCYTQLGQKDKQVATIEALEARFLNREYLLSLMSVYESQAADPHAMMNLYRLAFDQDFLTRESEAGIGKSAVKLIAPTDRNSRMLKQAKELTAEDKKLIGSLDKEARAGGSGEADVKVGLAFLGLGEFDKAVEAIERGLKPERVGKVKRLDDANMNLGFAYYKLGKKDEAIKAFTAAQTDSRMARAAKVWLLALQKI